MTSYVVFGLPGSGKGTLAPFLQQHAHVVQMCSGDLLRTEAKRNMQLQEQLQKGVSIQDSYVTRLVMARLQELCRSKTKFILDGFPQSEKQKEAMELLFANNPDLNVQFIIIDVEKEIALKRMASRFSCIECFEIFNSETRPSQKSGKCDYCLGSLKQRATDVGEAAKERLKSYEQTTRPIIEYYRQKSKTLVFDGNQPLEKILEGYKGIVQK